jgi:FkbM family methyltransferase
MLNFIETIRSVYGDAGPGVVLDVGTRDLDDSITLSKAFPNTKIYSFEPNPEQFKICQQNQQWYAAAHRNPLGEGPFPNIMPINCAISDQEGLMDFWVVGQNAGGSSLLEPIDVPYSDGTWHKIQVPCRRLDRILPELGVFSVDCVWMDVQGVELRALKGMGALINTVNCVHVEAAPRPYYRGMGLKDEIEQFLVSKGFDLAFRPEGHPYGEGNFIGVRR